MLEIFGVGRHLDVLVIELSFFGCFFLAGMANGGVERNFSFALWLTWCGLRNSSWLVWPAGHLAVHFCGQAAGEPRWKTGKERCNVETEMLPGWGCVAIRGRPHPAKKDGWLPASKHSPKSFPKSKRKRLFTLVLCTINHVNIPGRHCVVKDGIDGRVDVEHEAAEVENVEVHF